MRIRRSELHRFTTKEQMGDDEQSVSQMGTYLFAIVLWVSRRFAVRVEVC
jgi:hypothetical protein